MSRSPPQITPNCPSDFKPSMQLFLAVKCKHCNQHFNSWLPNKPWANRGEEGEEIMKKGQERERERGRTRESVIRTCLKMSVFPLRSAGTTKRRVWPFISCQSTLEVRDTSVWVKTSQRHSFSQKNNLRVSVCNKEQTAAAIMSYVYIQLPNGSWK